MTRSERYFEMKKDPVRWLEHQKRRAAQNKLWHTTNRKRTADYLKKWRKANPEKSRAYGKRAYARNGAERARKWRENNPQNYARAVRSYQLKNRRRINEKRRVWRLANRAVYLEQGRAEKRRYYARHAEKLKKKVLAHYYATKADPAKYVTFRKKRREALQAWRKRNPAKNAAYVREYQRKNPEKVRQWGHIRYIRKKGLKPAGSHTVGQWLARVEFYGWRCVYCGIKLNQRSLTKDHRFPLSKGGSQFPSNLVPACRSCNSRKRVKHPKHFPHSKG